MTDPIKPNKIPTRKIFAVLVAGAIVGTIQAALGLVWPEHPFHVLFEDLNVWIQMLIMLLAGIFVKEKHV